MIIISAMTKDHVIGSGESMPWNIPEEFQQFQNFIKGQTIIAGSRSFHIFKHDLTSKHNIVISRSTSKIEGASVFSSIEKANKFAKTTNRIIYCIGGAAIYKLYLPLADKMYLSYIKENFKGDTYFPVFDISDWEIEKRENQQNFEFVIYNRVLPEATV